MCCAYLNSLFCAIHAHASKGIQQRRWCKKRKRRQWWMMAVKRRMARMIVPDNGKAVTQMKSRCDRMNQKHQKKRVDFQVPVRDMLWCVICSMSQCAYHLSTQTEHKPKHSSKGQLFGPWSEHLWWPMMSKTKKSKSRKGSRREIGRTFTLPSAPPPT